MNLLRKLSDKVPEFFLGYCNTEKNYLLSLAFHEKSTKISSYFLGLNENPYLPLTADWAYIPLTTETKDISDYLKFAKSISEKYLPQTLFSIITDINMFFIRKDVNYTLYTDEIGCITQNIAKSDYFPKEVNKIKNSVLNLVKDFIAFSYLEPVYSKWVVSFLRDGIDNDIYKDILEEIGDLLSRVLKAVNNDFIGGKDLYSRLLSNNNFS